MLYSNKDPLTSKNNLEKITPSPIPTTIEGIPINIFSKKLIAEAAYETFLVTLIIQTLFSIF